MATTIQNQRWNAGRASYRVPTERIDTQAHEVAPVDEKTAKSFVLAHHYSGTYPAARERFGLFRGSELVGVSVFSHPCSNRVLTNVFPGEARDSVELGRFVLLDEVAGNGETWFLGQCFRELKKRGFRGVVSFSDPMPRRNVDGDLVLPGHVGTIYQAHNGVYLGRSSVRSLALLPDGTVFSQRARQKIRSGDRGWKYASAQLEAHGADPCPADSRVEWLSEWLPRLTRPARHRGNHRYAWALTRADRLAAVDAYPKSLDPEAVH